MNNPISNFTLCDGLICGSFFPLNPRDHDHSLPESTLTDLTVITSEILNYIQLC